MATQPVPGLAEAVEARRVELGLTPGELARAANLSREGLRVVRAGGPWTAGRPGEKTIFGIARALRWEPDWYDRIVVGEAPLATAERDGQDDEITMLREEVARLREIVERLDKSAGAQ